HSLRRPDPAAQRDRPTAPPHPASLAYVLHFGRLLPGETRGPGHPRLTTGGARRRDAGRLAAPPAGAPDRDAAAVVGSRSARYTLTCHVMNTGHATWPRTAPDGFGLVRLGAHLTTADGASAVQDSLCEQRPSARDAKRRHLCTMRRGRLVPRC